ncbi:MULTISPECIES: hypothetical protein [Pantoea]|uniref:hypothetical protein n=1 Tax=Pantoea TaxID=53335 RepID=UPI001093CFBF|nr:MULTISPECIES: hypothetical protein [Pantoea]QCA03211.1 hypothetical protein EGO56_03105 [Pantoea vagans]GME39804.1 hypothetical protein ACJ1_23720 [Pantoea sp. QMID1]GME40582.1 hypothetical protein ACJ3_25960 [Pantoea sp. QMID3]GME54950.1 hypothetical protein ACJ4_17930 [Pantoea sp. QMID4]GME55959.1 hypothetical protein ACJ2_17960 [Pantoea sp. QMID2]
MHHFLEVLSDLLTYWPVTSGKRDRRPGKDKKKISGLHYKPVFKITNDKNTDRIPDKDEAS